MTTTTYVYLLNIGPDGAIQALFPDPGQRTEHARLMAGESRDLSQETGLLLSTPGEETVKVIASSEPIDVTLFEAGSYEEYRGTRGSGLNPLERLLAEAFFSRGTAVSLREADWGTLQVAFPVAKP